MPISDKLNLESKLIIESNLPSIWIIYNILSIIVFQAFHTS